MERHQLFEAALVLALISLVGLLCLAIASTPPASYSWEAQANGSIDYMFVGSDDTLYAFSGNIITAVGKDGSMLWNLTIPAEWKVLNSWKMAEYTAANERGPGVQVTASYRTYDNYPIACAADGHLYIYAISSLIASQLENAEDGALLACPAVLIAISPNGIIEWENDVQSNLSAEAIPVINIQGDRVYLFHDYSEDVLDRAGKLLFTLNNISSPVAVDEKNRMYAVRGAKPPQGWPTDSGIFAGELRWGRSIDTYLVPSSLVEAYYPDGSLAWTVDIGINTTKLYVEQDLWPLYSSIPIYANHTLYVPVQRGYAALDMEGRLLWVRQVENGPPTPNGWAHLESTSYVPLSIMPVDSLGNAYLARVDWDTEADAVYVISPDGNVSLPGGNHGEEPHYLVPLMESLAGGNGIIYALDHRIPLNDTTFNESIAAQQLYYATVVAYDVKRATSLWNFTPPAEDTYVLTLNDSNYVDLLRMTAAEKVLPDNENAYLRGYFSLRSQGEVKVYPGRDIIYVNYYYAAYESPVTLDHSRCIYAKGIFALDKNGKLLWEKPVDGFVTKAAAGNGTIYYLTSNGKMGGGTAGITAGIALVAAAYLFLRFFLVGTVARARGRIDQNENRNRVFRHVVDNPGVTAVDLSRGLGMNIGTIRYHLFVLSINHKIVYHKEDGKYLRCFTNSGTYTPEERAVLSLLRRESLRRVLDALAESPGLTSLELSRRLGVSTTVAHRHINELMARDVIVKVCGTEKGNVYFINQEHLGTVANALGRAELGLSRP
jgi:predicted transcriptional regulator